MSNRAYIEQHEVTIRHNGEKYKEVVTFDNYTAGECLIDSYFDDDLELLQYCKDHIADVSDGVGSVLDSISESKKGVEINGKWYEWEQIQHIFFPIN